MVAETAEANLALSYFGATEGDLYEAFMKGARNPGISEKYSFFHTTDADCASKFGASAPGVAISRKFDESPLNYAGASTEDDLVAFGKTSSVPRLITFSEDFIEPIFGDRNPAVILFTEETGTPYQEVFTKAATDMQGEILFVTSGVTDGIQSRLAEFVGVTADDMPTVRIISPEETMLKFNYEGDAKAITGADVAKFVGDFKAGSLSPHLKSADIPDPQIVDGVTTLVGKTWSTIVEDPTKDVLVKYYAPWCGHCKALAPVWDELAKSVEDIEDLVIAKFDATENEVAGLDIRGYPTLKFYPKDNKAGVDYSGERAVEDFKAWLAENSSAHKAVRGEPEVAKVEGEAASEEL